MSQSKNTRRVLLSSVLAMVVCIAMLIGSTFAWFTDSVKSGNNKIVAGNLDIDVQYSKDKENWAPVEEASDIFDSEAVWEPGYTDVVYLKISNEGSLALKYQMSVLATDETVGINQADEEFKLSDYIQFGQVEDVDAKYEDRESAIAAVKENSLPISSGYAISGDMLANADEKIIALVVYMPDSVGNTANYKSGTTSPTIDLSLSLTATQLPSENDGFNNTYDTDAVNTMFLDSLKDSTKSKVSINSDVIIYNDTDRMNISSDKDIDFNDKKVIRKADAGNGLIIGEKDYEAYPVTATFNNTQFISESNSGAVRIESGSNVTFNNSSFTGNNGTYTNEAIQIANSNDGNKNVLRFNNCTFDGSVKLNTMNGPCEYDVEFNNCTFSGTYNNGQGCVLIDSGAYGDVKFDNCTMNVEYKGNAVCGINVKSYSGSNGNNPINITLKDTTITVSKAQGASEYSYGAIMMINSKNITNIDLLGDNSFVLNGISQKYSTEDKLFTPVD